MFNVALVVTVSILVLTHVYTALLQYFAPLWFREWLKHRCECGYLYAYALCNILSNCHILLCLREEAKRRCVVNKLVELDFCLTVHHQLGKVIQMNQLDATMIY